MATARANPRLQVGSASWITEERATALQFAGEETEEFTFSARNDLDWLNEHMAEIFSKNQVNVADIFKTPGKLRGKTPRTARKGNPLEMRAPLTDIFSAPNQVVDASPFKQLYFEKPVATFTVAEDEQDRMDVEVGPSASTTKHKSPPKAPQNFIDSGYHGSQPERATQATQATQPNDSVTYQQTPSASPERATPLASPDSDENVVILGRDSDARRTTEESFQSAEEQQNQNTAVAKQDSEEVETDEENKAPEQISYPVLESPVQERHAHPESPAKRSSPRRPSPVKQIPERTSSARSSPAKASPIKSSPAKQVETIVEEAVPEGEHEPMEDVQSPSEDGSPSPIRPIVRKSSLNFASLPAREPITTKKSIGSRVSRTSQLEQSRTSYYGRQTGGKSLGNARQDEQDGDEMDLDQPDDDEGTEDDTDFKLKRLHNKTSTQRLQDQISMLGQSQAHMRSSKSIPNNTVPAQVSQPSQGPVTQGIHRGKSPVRKSRPPPGAFPEDEEDSWIGPPPAAVAEPSIFSPRHQMSKSHSADVMEDIRGKDSIGGAQFNIPKRGDQTRHLSPVREPVIPDRITSTLGHVKSVSTSVLRSPQRSGESPGHMKPISVSNPAPSIASNDPEASTTPPKSPSRSHRGSPLKAAKDKFSSILKTSRGLFASSAAVSAEAKSNALSPVSRTGFQNAPSLEDVMSEANNKSPTSSHAPSNKSQMSLRLPDSPFKHSARKTRASTEREEKKREESARLAKEVKEAKEAQKQADQLEKARMKVREEARVYHMEQERVAAMQKEVAAKKEQEKQAKSSQSQVDLPRATRTSPRKTKAQLEAEGIAAAAATTDDIARTDAEISEASMAMPPPAIPRPKSQIGRPGPKRPLKPAKDAASKVKPPTVIRVDTSSQRGHHHHPSNVALSASLQDSLASQQSAPSQGLRHKASTSSIQSKASTSSFKSAANKALEAAARKKEQDELNAQRKREAKLEIERQRAANKEEERRKEELERKQERERQREVQRERERTASVADAKKAASRQAIEKRRVEMEKAKETRAPPPAVRSQPSVDLGSSMMQEKALPPIPPQRGDFGPSKGSRMNPAAQRPQEDMIRSMNSTLQSTAKLPPKRPLPQDSEDHHARPTLQRNGPSYQQEHQSKRRRTSEDFDDDEDMTEDHPKMTAPPIRQSSSRQKDMPTKSLFPSGYANAPAPGNLQRSTLIAQHNLNQSKPAHPMDMAQVSKAPIPFASSSGHANHKTPARPGQTVSSKSAAKSAAKSSPQYQNGENIVLPEIHTDSEDEEEENGDFVPANWTNSPDLRRALMGQEDLDPADIFGKPGPLNMEEVFSKNKDRFHKFRARTSSANWSGSDRLTEDEIRKDLQARDLIRRQGGWTHDSVV